MRKKNLPVCAPKTFEHEQFGQIRFVMIDWEPWFVAADVCKVLDIKNSRDAVSSLDDDEKMTVILPDGVSKNGVTNTVGNNDGISDATSSGWIENRVTVVSEPGLYRLIFMSRKPEAKKIKHWVFHEVLPFIRKHGYYVAPHQKITRIVGDKEFEAFKAQYPEGAVEIKRLLWRVRCYHDS